MCSICLSTHKIVHWIDDNQSSIRIPVTDGIPHDAMLC